MAHAVAQPCGVLMVGVHVVGGLTGLKSLGERGRGAGGVWGGAPVEAPIDRLSIGLMVGAGLGEEIRDGQRHGERIGRGGRRLRDARVGGGELNTLSMRVFLGVF